MPIPTIAPGHANERAFVRPYHISIASVGRVWVLGTQHTGSGDPVARRVRRKPGSSAGRGVSRDPIACIRTMRLYRY